MWRRACFGALLICAPGCSKILGIEDFTLGTDAGPDIDAPAPDALYCYGSGLPGPICTSMSPPAARTIDTALATDDDAMCTFVAPQTASGGPDLCVIYAVQITVSLTVVATGTRPLVLIGTDTIAINGTLDLSSKRTPARTGAGGNYGTCGAGTAPLNNAAGAGGGAGGNFQTKGLNGGDGNAINNNGTSAAIIPLTFVRGGCRGQDGGDETTQQGGTGGNGGGAVYMIAGTSITVAGNVYASGGGATAPTGLQAGGGGGGAGGLIGLEAPTITATGIIAANGANASGGGGSTGAGGAGADGATTTFGTQPAAAGGGAGTPVGGAGGRGATNAIVGTVGGSPGAAGAGGGGGGGIGYVWVKGTFTGTMVAPAPTLN